MKRILLSVLFISLFSVVKAEDGKILMIRYLLDSSVVDKTLEGGQSMFEFNFRHPDAVGERELIYSVDGVTERETLDGNKISILTTPGKHSFQFYYGQQFEEIYMDSIQIKEGYRDYYSVNLSYAYYQLEVDKPVIYLYPSEKMAVSVGMKIKGDHVFTYPVIENNTWNFTAFPNGDLQFGDLVYNYLFWESTQNRYLNHSEMKEGFIVPASDVVSFLEEKLSEVGLTSKERADFITYWAPRLSAHPLTYVHFEFNEACDQYAELEITPKPDEIYRIYMSWMPIDSNFSVLPQKMKKIERKGFTVLEWGGTETSRSRAAQNNYPIK